jgi:hypothetical protein
LGRSSSPGRVHDSTATKGLPPRRCGSAERSEQELGAREVAERAARWSNDAPVRSNAEAGRTCRQTTALRRHARGSRFGEDREDPVSATCCVWRGSCPARPRSPYSSDPLLATEVPHVTLQPTAVARLKTRTAAIDHNRTTPSATSMRTSTSLRGSGTYKANKGLPLREKDLTSIQLLRELGAEGLTRSKFRRSPRSSLNEPGAL